MRSKIDPGGRMKYDIVVTKDEDGMYTAECLNLPGCISQGKTKAEAMRNIRDAIKGYLESLKKHPEEHVYREISEIQAISL